MRIKKMLLASSVLFIFMGCSKADDQKTSDPDSVVTAPPKEQEPTSPEKFLIPKITFSHRLSDTYEIEGHLKNKASETTYGDMVVEVSYNDAAQKMVFTKAYPLDKTVKPGKSVSFFIREKVNDTVEGFTVKLISAKPVN